jgi:hypothetical protein
MMYSSNPSRNRLVLHCGVVKVKRRAISARWRGEGGDFDESLTKRIWLRYADLLMGRRVDERRQPSVNYHVNLHVTFCGIA